MKGGLFNRALRILLITNGIVLVAAAMLGPIYAVFVEEIGGDLLDAGLTAGVFALAAGLTTLISGKYADKIKESKKIIVLGYGMMSIGFFLYLFVDSIAFLFVIQIIIGFGEAIYSPPFDALYSKHLVKKKAGREWGAWESLNYFTYAGGAALGGWIAFTFGFSYLFIIMAALCLVSALYILFLPKRTL